MVDDVWRVAVNFQPRERFQKNAPMRERSLCAGACVDVVNTTLKVENLLKPLDVATRERELAQSQSRPASRFVTI